VFVAKNGRQALTLLRARSFDLVLLDIMMPEVSGFQVLEQCRSDPQLQHIPIVVISGNDDLDSVVRCVEMGAADYLFKPFDHVLFKARVDACLEKKRLRDQEQAYIRQLKAEQEKSERLLLNVLPAPIAARLKQDQGIIAEQFDDVTVLFADIVDFTTLAARVTPTELVGVLNEIFSLFDELAEQHELEKIKTIGDAYMVVGGLPVTRADHAEAIADMALDMRLAMARFNAEHSELFSMRIGISSGPAVAGVIGTAKFAYDLWGDTVNTASRMESHGLPGHIQVSAATYKRLREAYRFTARGLINVKGKGAMRTYLLDGKKVPRRSKEVADCRLQIVPSLS
jgi:class 3 adenylate cyclase